MPGDKAPQIRRCQEGGANFVDAISKVRRSLLIREHPLDRRSQFTSLDNIQVSGNDGRHVRGKMVE